MNRGYDELEAMLVSKLAAAGAKELYGQTPRGSLERKVADLMKQNGLDRVEI